MSEDKEVLDKFHDLDKRLFSLENNYKEKSSDDKHKFDKIDTEIECIKSNQRIMTDSAQSKSAKMINDLRLQVNWALGILSSIIIGVLWKVLS